MVTAKKTVSSKAKSAVKTVKKAGTSASRTAGKKKALATKKIKKVVGGAKKASKDFAKETQKFFDSLPGMHK